MKKILLFVLIIFGLIIVFQNVQRNNVRKQQQIELQKKIEIEKQEEQKRQKEQKRYEEKKRQEILAEKCKGQQSSLESYERSRYRNLGIQSFYDGPDAQYLGDCIYEVGSNFFDWQLEGQFNIYIKYRYIAETDSWERISAESYKAIRGEWVKQYY